MTKVIHPEQEISRSLEVLTDPGSYASFDLTADLQRIVTCIDPRDEECPERLKVAVQTAGAGVGKGLDGALALTADDGSPRTILEGMLYDRRLQRATVAGAHYNCRFVLGLYAVLEETARPSEFTTHTLRQLSSRYQIDISDRVPRIQDAAKRVRARLRPEDISEDALIPEVNRLHPEHRNVARMAGENKAAFYLLNHHPYVGLNRDLIHRGDSPLVATAYHDSLRASFDSLAGTIGMSKDVRALRLTALLMRAAATRTVLTRDSQQMRFISIVPGEHGLQFEHEHV